MLLHSNGFDNYNVFASVEIAYLFSLSGTIYRINKYHIVLAKKRYNTLNRGRRLDGTKDPTPHEHLFVNVCARQRNDIEQNMSNLVKKMMDSGTGYRGSTMSREGIRIKTFDW
jgi:hypothetical protein